MKPTIRFSTSFDGGNASLHAHDLCITARTLAALINRPFKLNDTHNVAKLGFDIIGITSPTSERGPRGKLEVPEISFKASFAPDNITIPAVLKPDSPEAEALHMLMDRYLLPAQLMSLYDMGYGKVIVRGDVKRFAKTLKILGIGYEFLKGNALLVLKKFDNAA